MGENANLTKVLLILVFLVTATCSMVAGRTIYVDDDATAGGNGESWESAYKYLQDALFYASSGDEIFVGEGTYRPDEDSAHPSGTGDREATFQLNNGVVIKGGYAGFGQTDPDARDIEVYETVLSGDLLGNDGPDFANNDENSYHVVTGSGTDKSAILDGFTISSGKANGAQPHVNGGGMFNSGGKPTLINCALTDNYARGSGGGMYNWSSSPTVTNCTFNDNQAENGGGMYNYRSSLTVTNCTFSDNSCWNGGGMFNDSGSPTIANCTFSGNSADNGGGMRNYNSSPTVTNCMFSGNSAGWGGGGMANNHSSPTVTNCMFTDNTAGVGGGMHNLYSSATVENCIFIGNSAVDWGGGMTNRDCTSSLTVTNCIFTDNLASWGGGMRNYTSSTTVINCTFSNNSAQGWEGGGMSNRDGGNPTLINCTFSGNSSALRGGGIYSDENSSSTITNSILWENSDAGGTDESAQIDNDGPTPVITYTCIQGWTGSLGGIGNIKDDPWFVQPGYWNAHGVWIDGDYHLQRGSPCINAGDNSAVPSLLSTDLDGNPRIAGGTVDMGVYEFWSPLILYVDRDAGGANDGSSWVDAYNYLQDALFFAQSGDEIRVAEGIYKPIAYIPPPPPPLDSSNVEESLEPAADRTATFQLINGVVIKGGYAGFGEPVPDGQDPNMYETVLSGDIGIQGNSSDNSYHVVTGSGCDETAVLDGFTITAGYASGTYPDPEARGGGMYNDNGSPTVINCTFEKNFAEWGAGVHNEYSSPILKDCIFRDNYAIYDAGGLYNRSGGCPRLTNCTFKNNSAGRAGGGLGNGGSSDNPELFNCIFSGNLANYGGAMECRGSSSPIATNCTFVDNEAIYDGGGIWNRNTRNAPQFYICIIWGNRDQTGAGEFSQIYGGTPVINYSCIQGWTGVLGGTGNISDDPCFVEPGYFSPVSYWKFDEADGTTVYDSFGQNHGTVYGAQWASGQVSGALDFDGIDDYVDIPYDSSLDIDASEGISLSVWIKLNSYPDSLNQGPIFGLYDGAGGGTKNYLSIMKSTYGNVISWDQWPPSSGWLESIKPDLDAWYHIVVVEDSSHRAIYINGSLDVSDNTPESYEGYPPDTIRIGSRADDFAPFYFYGAIDEVAIYDRSLSAEEIWQLSESPNYRLQPGSPCIDTGDPNYVAEPNETDLDGNPRVIGGRIDMGAYEFFNTPPVADAGADQIVECECNTEGGTKVILDGTGSYDADGDPLTYTWTGPFVESKVHGATPTVILEDGCPGEYVITLIVNDGIDDSEPNEVLITVVDTTPPEFALSVSPMVLWPPNHKMVEITPSWTVSDECDASPDVLLVSIVANEGDDIIGDGHTTDDIQIDDDGSIFVRSERSGPSTGRIYTITYQAVDDCGNVTVRSATVSIPHELKLLARMGNRWLWRNLTGNLPEDLNGDGIVNLKDIAIFANNWIQ